MTAKRAATVLESMMVPGWPGVYVLGCIDRRVTIYSQQVRALNLAAVLVASKHLSAGEQAVVVGAGAAGLTCAAGLQRLGAKVSVLEQKSAILSLFRLGSQRWLHPGVYDWPLDGWDRDRADLPVLDWEQGQVKTVLRQLENAWEQERQGIKTRLDVGLVGIGSAGEEERTVTWQTGSVRTRTVILAVGFGLEPTPLADERSYWEADTFDHDRADGSQRWLVSGCGDGALTDLFRLCIRDFRHDRLLLDFTEDQRMGELRERIRQIETDAAIQRDPAKLHDAYEQLECPWVVDAIQKRARGHEVTLVAPTANYLSIQASPLNRFLAAQLLRAKRFRFLQDRVESAEYADSGVKVEFEISPVQRFDRIVRRHGPESALALGFPAIATALERDRRDRRERPTLTDQTRERFWVEGAFGGLRTPRRAAAARASAAQTEPRREPRPDAGALSPEDLEHYRRAMIARHGKNQFIGFDMAFEYHLPWDQLYVEIDMHKAHGHSKRPSFAEGSEVSEQTESFGLDQAFARARICNQQAMVLLGGPGSGKTTQLRQMLLRALAEDGPTRLGLPAGTVPVFVALRELSLPPVSEPLPALEDLVCRALAAVDGVSKALAQRILAQPSVLYLIDGLDEIADEQQRVRMAEVIAHAQEGLSQQHLLVSSRYAGYADVKDVHLDNNFLELRLQRLNDSQIDSIVSKWHEAVDALEAQESGRPPSRKNAERRTRDFLTRLRAGDAQLEDLSRTPLLLTVLCLIHRNRGGLPSRRSEIYEQCETLLLVDWRKRGKRRREGVSSFNTDKTRGVLEHVAFWLHDKGLKVATNIDLRDPVGRGLAAVDYGDWSPEKFIGSFASESGLLTPWGLENHGFVHHGFQEHLAAGHLRARGTKQPELLTKLVAGKGEGWWREVSRMTLEEATPELRAAFNKTALGRPELEAWSRTRMLGESLRDSARTSLAKLEAMLQAPLEDERLSTALRLLVHWVLPELPADELKRLDARLREHPSETVRRRWLTRPRPSEAPRTTSNEKSGVELVQIPAGWFSIGSAHDDDAGYNDERPQHEVELESFYLARTPVTNAQYERYLAEHSDAPKPEYWGGRRFNQPDQPVVGVSVDEAVAYCKWAGLVLPTEAQWEYACRAGTTTGYWSGDTEADLARVGWYSGNSDQQLHAVGEKEANPFGLYDMHGNVREWCHDGWVNNYETKPRPGDGLRHEPVTGGDRVIRGGSWFDSARVARSAYRNVWLPGVRSVFLGFRPAQVIP